MKILIDDGNQIQVGTGIGKYSLYLYKALKEIGCSVSLVDQKTNGGKRLFNRIKYLVYINSRNFRSKLQDFDTVLFTNYAMPFKKNKNVKYAVTVPDMVAFLHPQTLPFVYRYYNQLMIINSIKKADIIFTISHSVESEIIKKFPKYKNKIHTTWLGLIDQIRPLQKYNNYENVKLKDVDESPYFLFVSTVEKRKNVGIVLDAFIKLKQSGQEANKFRLVIVGRPGYGYDEFVSQAAHSAYKNDIIFAGYTSDADCNRLYNHATAFIFPTVYEGFGFAQIECMRCHLPIILSDIPTNREISREYGEFFDINDVDTLVAKMRIFVSGDYDYKNKNSLADKYIKEFDWNEIANQYAAILKNEI